MEAPLHEHKMLVSDKIFNFLRTEFEYYLQCFPDYVFLSITCKNGEHFEGKIRDWNKTNEKVKTCKGLYDAIISTFEAHHDGIDFDLTKSIISIFETYVLILKIKNSDGTTDIVTLNLDGPDNGALKCSMKCEIKQDGYEPSSSSHKKSLYGFINSLFK